VQMRQMTFRSHMSKEMGDVAECGSFGADAALEQARRHWRRLLPMIVISGVEQGSGD